MPSCCVPNCKNRTSYVFQKQVKFFLFPKDEELRKKWLQAIRREDNFKLISARICEEHFRPDCFEEVLTKPRSQYAQPRTRRRLKSGSIPTELLILPKGRVKRMSTKRTDQGETSSLPIKSEEVKQEDVQEHCQPEQQLEIILSSLKEIQSERDELLIKNQFLITKNEQLSARNARLSAEAQQMKESLNTKDNIIENMRINAHKSGKKVASDILHRVFTPGQVKKILSPDKSRVQWTAEDISSAITLRNISAEAYQHLREVQNIPLPCAATLRNWTAHTNTSSGIQKINTDHHK